MRSAWRNQTTKGTSSLLVNACATLLDKAFWWFGSRHLTLDGAKPRQPQDYFHPSLWSNKFDFERWNYSYCYSYYFKVYGISNMCDISYISISALFPIASIEKWFNRLCWSCPIATICDRPPQDSKDVWLKPRSPSLSLCLRPLGLFSSWPNSNQLDDDLTYFLTHLHETSRHLDMSALSTSHLAGHQLLRYHSHSHEHQIIRLGHDI